MCVIGSEYVYDFSVCIYHHSSLHLDATFCMHFDFASMNNVGGYLRARVCVCKCVCARMRVMCVCFVINFYMCIDVCVYICMRLMRVHVCAR